MMDKPIAVLLTPTELADLRIALMSYVSTWRDICENNGESCNVHDDVMKLQNKIATIHREVSKSTF